MILNRLSSKKKDRRMKPEIPWLLDSNVQCIL